jgi:hypothetical protein
MIRPVQSAETSVSEPELPRGPMLCKVDMAALCKLSMEDLQSFADAMSASMEVINAFRCQPRFSRNGRSSAAGLLLEDIVEFLGSYEQAAINTAIASRPIGKRDAEVRAWLLLRFHARMADSLAEFAVLAAEGARDAGELAA